jgi:hypothetical protein
MTAPHPQTFISQHTCFTLVTDRGGRWAVHLLIACGCDFLDEHGPPRENEKWLTSETANYISVQPADPT